MRRIIFRGFDTIGKKWVYGDLTHNLKVGEKEDTQRVMVGGYEVDPESVGQFTGYMDMNGNGVYEGDIVQDLWNIVNVVVWDKEAAGLYLYGGEVYSTFMDIEFETFKVLGNAYENPELLKEDDKKL